MTSELHDELIAMSARWLRRNGFGVVATEISAVGCREQPDAIGFRQSCSAIVEAKASRSDFLADRRKPERSGECLGLGVYRFYICPEGLILPDEIPAGWGLLYAAGRQVTDAIRPDGNGWPPYGGAGDHFRGWVPFQHRSNLDAERSILYSIALRQTKLHTVGDRRPSTRRRP